jgi:hypothetical protein
MKDFIIEPTFSYNSYDKKSFSLYLDSLQKLIKKIIPKEINEIYPYFLKNLPIISFLNLKKPPSCFSFIVIYDMEKSFGFGRFFADVLCKWLIPWKDTPLLGSKSINFKIKNKDKRFYMIEYYVFIENQSEYLFLQKNIKNFIEKVKINIQAVEYANLTIFKKNISFDKKSFLIKKKLNELLKKNLINDSTIYFNKFINKIFAEKNLKKIKENLNLLIKKNKKKLDTNVLSSIYKISLLNKNSFIAVRNPIHVSKIIFYLYLLKKEALNNQKNKKESINIKTIKTKKNVLGILISINFLKETERFLKKHLINSIKSFNSLKYIEDSFIEDSVGNITTMYIEVEKTKNVFLKKYIKIIKDRLPQEIKERTENLINPISLKTNEKELDRNSNLLCKQLKYVNDNPQIIISYDKQEEKNIIFTIILVRLLKNKTKKIKTLFSKKTKYKVEKTNILGFIKKYPKERSIIKVSLNKKLFFRKNFSLNIQQARETISKDLKIILKEFRDYNGGMLDQQNKAFLSFKKSLPKVFLKNEFLLENFFYSIRPTILQSILETDVIKKFFHLFFESSEYNLKKNDFIFKSFSMQKYIIVMIGSFFDSFKSEIEKTIKKLSIPPINIASFSLKKKNIYTHGYILRSSDLSFHSYFYNLLSGILHEWKKSLKKNTSQKIVKIINSL